MKRENPEKAFRIMPISWSKVKLFKAICENLDRQGFSLREILDEFEIGTTSHKRKERIENILRALKKEGYIESAGKIGEYQVSDEGEKYYDALTSPKEELLPEELDN